MSQYRANSPRHIALSLLVCGMTLAGLSSCSKDLDPVQPVPEEKPSTESTSIEGCADDLLRIEVSEEVSIALRAGTLRSVSPEVQSFMDRIGAEEIVPVFDEGEGAYRERRRRAGLHRWFDVRLRRDAAAPTHALLRALDEVHNIEGVVYAEPVPYIGIPQSERRVIPAESPRQRAAGDATGKEMIPNDPRFADQWYLYNYGQEKGFVPGFDINVLDAWKEETGRHEVVVAVLDEGVQITHPDLVANIWTNPSPDAEMEDLHGYNFSKDQTEIDAGDHGTHVAGVIAATRNNGIGIAGVAGGDGTEGSGVRIMSCEIISNIANLRAAPNAFVYAADHGAVISNNSWGMGGGPDPDAIPKSYKVAIDYFIDNAGCDPVTGEQLPTSPMKGGVAIFSAGNDNKEYYYMPPAYKRVIAVGSNGPTGVRAIYSNHGEWVDISAPGGDYRYGNPTAFILSTIADDLYGYMEGTSMAAPLVTGVAALITSKLGGQGFTNEELVQRLLTSLRPYDIDELNPDYRGKLGNGYIDATKALAIDQLKAPAEPVTVEVESGYGTIHLSYEAVADADDGTALSYLLYIAEGKQVDHSRLLSEPERREVIHATKYQAGDRIEYEVKDLHLDSHYSMALVAVDRWGHTSQPVYLTGVTKANHRPIVTGVSRVVLPDATPVNLSLEVKDPDGHDWSYKLAGDTQAVMSKREGDNIILTFRRLMGVGSYTLSLVVTDGFESTVVSIPYEITANGSPIVASKPAPIYVRQGAERSLDLSSIFSDPEGSELTFTVSSATPELLELSVEGSQLRMKGVREGTAHIEVTATDPQGGYVRLPLTILVVPDAIVYQVYPIPCRDHLTLRLSEEVDLARIRIETPTGAVVLRRTVTVRDPEDRLVNLSTTQLSIGRYILVVEAVGKVYRKSIVKN